MSQDEIHAVASKSTPEDVQIPNTMTGLVTWAVGKFGGAAVIAIALSYAIIRIYTDMQVQNATMLGDQKAVNAQVMEMVRSATQTQADVAAAMRELSKQIEANTRAVEVR